MTDIERDREEIRQLLASINAAWTGGRVDDLSLYFHEDMIIAQPGFGVRGEGRSACVESYKEFTAMAEIKDLRESEHVVLVWGDTAVASYKFEVEYEMEGRVHHDTGYDLFVFTRESGTWLAVWRTILPVPGP
jgi:ketosteroid isomerase-like protein